MVRNQQDDEHQGKGDCKFRKEGDGYAVLTGRSYGVSYRMIRRCTSQNVSCDGNATNRAEELAGGIKEIASQKSTLPSR